jgi:hypothetical protein
MNKFYAAGLLPLCPLLALAAPAHADTAAATISQLQSQGYNVSVNRVGNGTMDQCTVIGVRTTQPPNPFSMVDDDDLNVFTVAPKPKAVVSLNCAN